MKLKIISLSLVLVLAFSCQNEKFTPSKELLTESNELNENPQLKYSYECDNICDNCVMYVVCKLRVTNSTALPAGVDYSSYSAKLGVINTASDYSPIYGDVAIFDTGTAYGHMAFVEWKSPWTGVIFISESNWDGNCVSWRSNGRRDAYSGLKGFYHP